MKKMSSIATTKFSESFFITTQQAINTIWIYSGKNNDVSDFSLVNKNHLRRTQE